MSLREKQAEIDRLGQVVHAEIGERYEYVLIVVLDGRTPVVATNVEGARRVAIIQHVASTEGKALRPDGVS